MNDPLIPVSWGEVFDRTTILEIKRHRLRLPQARANAARELDLLAQAAPAPMVPRELTAALIAVNTRLWRLEDLIRESEAAGDFGPGFVRLARAIYRENDERGRIKQALNRLLHSDLVEQKQYPAYV